MVPKLKFDEELASKLDSELETQTGDAQVLQNVNIHHPRGKARDPFIPNRPNLAHPRFSWFILLNLLRRHSLSIAISTLLALAVGAYGVSVLKNQYTATALLILDQSSVRLLWPENPPVLNVDGEAELLKSENIALRVIDNLQLTADPEYRPESGIASRFVTRLKETIVSLLQALGLRNAGEETPALQETSGVQPLPPEKAAVLQILKRNITIRRRGLTDLLAVEAKAEDPQRAARIANAYAQAYLDEQVALKAQTIERAEKILSQQLAELNEELKRSETQIGLRQRFQESVARLRAITQKRETLSPDARIVSPARPPLGPTFPSARLLGALGIAFSAAVGLGLALGVAVFREANQRRVYTEDEVEAASGVINLTVIPRHQSDFKRRETRRNGGVKNNSAVRKLFFSLQLMDQKSVKLSAWLITSSRSEQEKAELGISLARLAAASGLKVVIIDCNLRRPELHKALGMENEKGLVDLLMARSDVQNVLQNDPVSDCRFIAAGLVDDSMVERCLRAERLKSAMRKLRLEFDIIILVAPSLGQSADPLMLMSVADGALFVVPSGEETLSGLRSNVQQLRRSSEAQIFTVLTNSPVND